MEVSLSEVREIVSTTLFFYTSEQHLSLSLSQSSNHTHILIHTDSVKEAHLLGKSQGVLCGRPYVQAVFDEVGCSVEWFKKDGDFIDGSDKNRVVVAKVRGPIRKLLLGERLALNIMTRASGISTVARKVQDLADKAEWKGLVAGTSRLSLHFFF